MTIYNKNIVTDFGIPSDGTSDCSAAWTANITPFLTGLNGGDEVIFTAPSLRYVLNGPGGFTLFRGVLGGLKITLNAGVSTFFGNSAGGVGFGIAGFGVGVDFSRIASVGIGATSIILLTPSEHTLYQVGQWVAITGYDTQGYGNPPNPAFCEYRQITSKDTVNGVLRFSAPLKDQYLSTWPSFGSAGFQQPDLGGAATAYPMPVQWDIDLTINGVTFDQAGQVYSKCRRTTFRGGGVASGATAVSPTACERMTFDGFKHTTSNVELDKMVGTCLFLNGSDVHFLSSQSMCSANLLVVKDTTVTAFQGTPRNAFLSNVTTGSLSLGATGQGRTDGVTVVNSNIAAISAVPRTIPNIIGEGYTMSGGVIRWPLSNKAIPWAVPGTYFCFFGHKECETPFYQVLSVTFDATDTIVRTTAPGGFPTVPLGTGTLGLKVHPCPVWRGSGNVGCADILDLNQAGAQGKPLYSYSKRSYTAGDLNSASYAFQVWGLLSAINMNVTQLYTGTQLTLTAEALGQFGGSVLSVDRTVEITYDPVLNLKQLGQRTITPGAVSGQSGDTLGSAPGNVWLAGPQGIFANHDVTGEASNKWPIVEIEIIAEQGVVASADRLVLAAFG